MCGDLRVWEMRLLAGGLGLDLSPFAFEITGCVLEFLPGPHVLSGQAGREEEGGWQTCKGLWVPEKQLLNLGSEEPALHPGRVADQILLQRQAGSYLTRW